MTCLRRLRSLHPEEWAALWWESKTSERFVDIPLKVRE